MIEESFWTISHSCLCLFVTRYYYFNFKLNSILTVTSADSINNIKFGSVLLEISRQNKQTDIQTKIFVMHLVIIIFIQKLSNEVQLH